MGADVGGPAWPRGIFAIVMLTVAAYCAVRPVVASRRRRMTDLDTDGAHVVTGIAMAGMLTASLRVLPAAAWGAVFAGGVVWFAWRAAQVRRGTPANMWRCPHPVPHLVESVAMLYMLAVAPSGMGSMAAATTSRFSVLALGMALFMFGYVVWVGNQLAPATAADGQPAAGQPCPPHLAPRCAALCKIAMGITMGYALVLML